MVHIGIYFIYFNFIRRLFSLPIADNLIFFFLTNFHFQSKKFTNDSLHLKVKFIFILSNLFSHIHIHKFQIYCLGFINIEMTLGIIE